MSDWLINFPSSHLIQFSPDNPSQSLVLFIYLSLHVNVVWMYMYMYMSSMWWWWHLCREPMRRRRWPVGREWRASCSASFWAWYSPSWWVCFHGNNLSVCSYCDNLSVCIHGNSLSVCIQGIFLLWIPGLGIGVFAPLYSGGNFLALIR